MYHFLHLINILKDVFDHFPKISEDSQEVAPDFHLTPPARAAYKAKFTKNYLSFDCSTACM